MRKYDALLAIVLVGGNTLEGSRREDGKTLSIGSTNEKALTQNRKWLFANNGQTTAVRRVRGCCKRFNVLTNGPGNCSTSSSNERPLLGVMQSHRRDFEIHFRARTHIRTFIFAGDFIENM